jgi:AraC-like DNA-binding protein
MATRSKAPAVHRMPLGGKPVIKQVGLNVHGQQRVERYFMDGLWSLHAYRWKGSLSIGGRNFEVRPGAISIEPPNKPLVWRYDQETCPHYYVHFALPSGDGRVAVPVIQDMGEGFEEICEELERLIGLYASKPIRAEIRLWDLLWRLAAPHGENASTTVSGLPYAVQTAVAIIENELTRVSAGEVCRRVAVSQNHLTRLFRRSFGCGVGAYIRRRRAEKALALLERSNLPIKTVAAEIGLPDLHQFNKFVRKELGRAPSRLRKEPVRKARG